MLIRTELNTSRALKDGTYPITLLFQSKGKQNRLKTGLSCKKGESFWKNGKFTSKVDDYKEKNKQLEDLLLKFNTRKKEIEDANQEVTFELLTNNEPLFKKDSHNFISIIREKANTVGYTTSKFYLRVANEIEKDYGEFVDIKTINQQWMDAYRVKIDAKYPSQNRLKNRLLGAVGASLALAVRNGYIEYHRLKEIKKFNAPINTHKLNLKDLEFSAIMNAYKKDVVSGGNPVLRPKQEEAFALFMLTLAFQGLNPVDIAMLKVKDLEEKTIMKYDINLELFNNDKEYQKEVEKKQEEREIIKVKTNRKKNGNPVYIVADKQSMLHILEVFKNGKDDDAYLVNCLQNGKEYRKDNKDDMEELDKKRKSYFESNSQILTRYMKYFWEREKLNEKFGEWERKVNFLQFRHKFANLLLSENYSNDEIRRYMGHIGGSRQVLEQHYLEETPEWVQSEAIYKIFNNREKIKDLLEWRDQHRKRLKD